MDRARASEFERPRPRLRGFDASTTLVDFALVTFDVDADRLASLLPPGLRPETRSLDDGRVRAFVSAVSFRDVDFRFAILPIVRRSFFQTNYRAYVLGPTGGRAVYFFGTTLDSRLSVLPRRLWGMPWHPGATRIEATWDGDRCVTYRHTCHADWGGADVLLRGTPQHVGRLDGFKDADDAAVVLTHPLDTYFSRPDGRPGQYGVWHPRLSPTLGHADTARYSVFENLNLVAPNTPPHSVMLQRHVPFDVLLPPAKIG